MPYNWISEYFRILQDEVSEIDEELYRRILVIRSATEDRVKQLAKVNKAISRLRYVFLVVDGVDREPQALSVLMSPRASRQAAGAAGDSRAAENEALVAFARRETRTALTDISAILSELMSEWCSPEKAAAPSEVILRSISDISAAAMRSYETLKV
jgi:hypothetical protein